MKSRILTLFCSFLCDFASAGERDFGRLFGEYKGAFVLLDASREEWIRYGEQSRRYSPCSTFKIANALIAIETRVAEDPELRVAWNGINYPIPEWNRYHTLRSAFRVSCVWYYQEIARRVGASRMGEWVRRLDYGNGDTSGGVDRFWLSSSLVISPEEQVRFLQKLSRRELPVSDQAVDAVLDVMTVSRGTDYVYRGKTGTAGDAAIGRALHGWWVGSLRVAGRDYYFAALIVEGSNPSGRNARRVAEAILAELEILPVGVR